MAQNETFDLAGPAGRLEALLMLPDDAPQATAVVCHAHPLHGGMMHFKPVFRAAKALQQHGLAVLRFNFRGVGRSEGTHDNGVGEQDDVRTALDEMARRFPGLPQVLGGFSFGSVMAARVAATDARVRGLVVLGFPVRSLANTDFLNGITQPRLFVQGAQDEFGSGAVLREIVDRLPPPRELVVVPGCGHFFADHLDEMQAAVDGWAGRAPWA